MTFADLKERTALRARNFAMDAKWFFPVLYEKSCLIARKGVGKVQMAFPEYEPVLDMIFPVGNQLTRLERGKDRIGLAIIGGVLTAALTEVFAIMGSANFAYPLVASGGVGAIVGGAFASYELMESRFSSSVYDRPNAFGKTIRTFYLLGSAFTVPITNFILGTIDLAKAAMGNNEIKKRTPPEPDEAHMARIMEHIGRMQPQQPLYFSEIGIDIPEAQK